jgi:hypothetical protein
MVAVGLTDNQWLLSEIDQNRDDVKELNALCSIARQKAGEGIKSAWGTVVHWFTECIDNDLDWEEHDPPDDVIHAAKEYGEPLDVIYKQAAGDLDAYEFATQDLTTILTEQFVVCDDARAAGTADRASHYGPTNKAYVCDLKTGRVDHGGLKFAIQMAIYARGDKYVYNPDTAVREPLGDFENITGAAVIRKGQGQAPQPNLDDRGGM